MLMQRTKSDFLMHHSYALQVGLFILFVTGNTLHCTAPLMKVILKFANCFSIRKRMLMQRTESDLLMHHSTFVFKVGLFIFIICRQCTPLQYAAERSYLEIIRLLLDSKAHVETKRDGYLSPLSLSPSYY